MEAPPFSNLQEEDDSLFNYLNGLSPLKDVGATQTLNSLAMDFSLFTSPDVTLFEESAFFIARDDLLDTSNPQVLSENVPTIYSTQDYSLELSSQQAVQYGSCSCSPDYQSLISRDDANYLLGLLAFQESNVQDDSIKDSIEGGTYIPELGQIEANPQVPDFDHSNLISTQSLIPLPQSTSNYKLQTVDPVDSYEPIASIYRNQTRDNLANFALMDTKPIQTGNDELVRIRHSIQMGFLDYDKTSYTSNIITSTSSKSDERNARNENSFSLNAIPASNHYKGIENEMTYSGRNSELPSCTSLHLSESHLSQVSASMENHLGPSDNKVQSTKGFTKFLLHITGEDFCRSTLKMKTKQLDPSNMKRKRKDEIDLVGSCSKHEKEEESADFGQSTIKKKRRIHKSGHCQCKNSSCLRKYCECFKGGVGCSPSCKCQGCENIHGRKDWEAKTKSELDETEALRICRPLLPLPYLSLENPKRCGAELFSGQKQELVESNAIGSVYSYENIQRSHMQ